MDRHVRLVENAVKEQEAILLSQGYNIEAPSSRITDFHTPHAQSTHNGTTALNGQQSGDSTVNQDPAGLPFATRSSQRNVASSRQARDQSRQESLLANLPIGVVDGDLPVNPHEPRYCYCNQVSFGMVDIYTPGLGEY